VKIGLYTTTKNHFLKKVMFGKNSFFPKTKTVKIGLGGVCQTYSKAKENLQQKHCQPNKVLTFDPILTRNFWFDHKPNQSPLVRSEKKNQNLNQNPK
jgi:hypothetical protein